MTDSVRTPLSWMEDGTEKSALWVSESGSPAPRRLLVVDDELKADDALVHARAGTGMIWRGDYFNARQLLSAMTRRLDAPSKKSRRRKNAPLSASERFHKHRLAQSQRARALAQVLVPVSADHTVQLRRAPNITEALSTVLGEMSGPYVIRLRELLGIVSALEWRRSGIPIEELNGAHITAHYGVFPPTRREYLKLVAAAPVPEALAARGTAFDIGTGTGVLAALLAHRGVQKVVATDTNERALACAKDNVERLQLAERVVLEQTDLFPEGKAALVVCNPPWLPGKPTSPLETAVYDPVSQMLRGWLTGLAEHLEPEGEGWLILSDLAEHLELRSREELLQWIEQAGLTVLDRLDTTPTHKKASDANDPLHAARSAEVTSLWRLSAAPQA